MKTVVLDTNVLASGFLGYLILGSSPGKVLRAWRDGRFTLIVSTDIVEELERTFQSSYFISHLTADDVRQALLLLRAAAKLTPITAIVKGVATHREDDRILAAAVSAAADYLVTGDAQLQSLRTYKGVSIVTPRAFLDLLKEDKADS